MPSKPKRKRIFVGSDPHCGHMVGLTPPSYQIKQSGRGHTQAAKRRHKFAKIQDETWNKYIDLLAPLKPFDAQFWLGDIIDGLGEKSKAGELITADLPSQSEMFVECAEAVGAPHFIAVYGTAYHTTAGGQDWEDHAVEMLRDSCKKIDLGSHEWPDVNNCIFDMKHKIGSSSVPYGRLTALEREKVWNDQWAKRDWAPQSEIILRGHVHYFKYSGDREGLRVTMPALQGLGSKFGSRICSGTVDWGFLMFDVEPDGSWDMNYYTPDIESQKARTIKV